MKNEESRKVIAIFGHEKEVDIDGFNRKFWRSCTVEQKIDAGWDLVVQAWKTKGYDTNELRLQRSTVFFKPA